jgi:branched-chain amino acid transport system permease protein
MARQAFGAAFFDDWKSEPPASGGRSSRLASAGKTGRDPTPPAAGENVLLFLEQLLNGLQYGVMLFLLAAGLTLIFGIMGGINLAHGSLYMIGAYAGAVAAAKTGSFLLAAAAALGASAAAGLLIEFLVVRKLYERDHLDQVLATYGVLLFANELMVILNGRTPLFMQPPGWLSGSVEILPGIPYPTYRLAIIVVGAVVAIGLFALINRTRVGMLIRAGATHREMVGALGVDVRRLYTLVFGLGALLCGLAGLMAAPVLSVQVGMGEQILIATFVVIVVGGLGSVRGALVGALLVGMVDTLARAFLPAFLKSLLPATFADALAAGLGSIAIYLLMAIVLIARPRGLVGS